MSLRNGLSKRLAAGLLARCRRHLGGGTAMSVRPSTWRVMPDSVQAWLKYRVFTELETRALCEVRSHEVLHRFASDMEQNRWAMTPSSLVYLWNLLESSRPGRIVEFGSGLSTRLFAEYARRMKSTGLDVSLLSIEHDEHWLSQTRDALVRDQAGEFVTFCHAPISNQTLLGRTLDAYTIAAATFEKSAGANGFELCLVDGPPGTIGRGGCLPLVSPFLARGAVVLLDDALRPGELDVCTEWSRVYRHSISAPRLQLVDRHGLMQTTWTGPGYSRAAQAGIPLPNAPARKNQHAQGPRVGTMNGLS